MDLTMRSRDKIAPDGYFYPLWLAAFITSFGSSFFLFSTAINYVAEFETALSGALIFASQSALVFLTPFLVSFLTQSASLSRSNALLEGLGLGLSLLLLLNTSSYFWLVSIIAVRGILDVTAKTLRFVTVKELAGGSEQKSTTAYLSSAYYLGGFGSVVLLAVKPDISLESALSLNVVTYGLAALLSWCVLDVRVAEYATLGAWRQALRDVLADRSLLQCFISIVVVTAAFQGFHNAARTYLPLVHLNLGQTAVAGLQFISSVAIVGGAIIAGRLTFGSRSERWSATSMVALATVALISSLSYQVLPLSFAFYFLFILCFEIAFTQYQMDIVSRAPMRSAGKIIATNQAVGWASLSIGTVFAAWSIDTLGFIASAMLAAAIALSVSLFLRN